MIDDAPIEESGSDGEDSDASAGPKKRKKSDDELDDRLEDEDYDLIEENLGVKVARVSTFCVSYVWGPGCISLGLMHQVELFACACVPQCI